MDIEYLQRQLDQAVRFYEWKRWYYTDAGLVEIESRAGNVVVRGDIQEVYDAFCRIPFAEEQEPTNDPV